MLRWFCLLVILLSCLKLHAQDDTLQGWLVVRKPIVFDNVLDTTLRTSDFSNDGTRTSFTIWGLGASYGELYTLDFYLGLNDPESFKFGDVYFLTFHKTWQNPGWGLQFHVHEQLTNFLGPLAFYYGGGGGIFRTQRKWRPVFSPEAGLATPIGRASQIMLMGGYQLSTAPPEVPLPMQGFFGSIAYRRVFSF